MIAYLCSAGSINLEKRRFLFFSYLVGRDRVAAMRASAKGRMRFFCAPSGRSFCFLR